MGRLAGCNRCDSRVHLDPGCGDISDYLLDRRGRLSDFVFRVDVRGLVWVAPKARLAKCDRVRHADCIVRAKTSFDEQKFKDQVSSSFLHQSNFLDQLGKVLEARYSE